MLDHSKDKSGPPIVAQRFSWRLLVVFSAFFSAEFFSRPEFADVDERRFFAIGGSYRDNSNW
jgi:hypothetical protein